MIRLEVKAREVSTLENSFKTTALQKLTSLSSKETLLDWISWLDLACATASPVDLSMQLLTRSVVAAGWKLVEKQYLTENHPVRRTIDVAEAYSLEPTEDHFDRYFHVATLSYPYGSGEGCYAVAELGYSQCEPGSGCRSGAGCLYQIAIVIGFDVVSEGIVEELLPWLEGKADHIRLRTNRTKEAF